MSLVIRGINLYTDRVGTLFEHPNQLLLRPRALTPLSMQIVIWLLDMIVLHSTRGSACRP